MNDKAGPDRIAAEPAEPTAVPNSPPLEPIQAAGRAGSPPVQPVTPSLTPPPGPQSRQIDKAFFLRIGLQIGGFFLAGILLLVLLGFAQRLGWLSGPGVDAAPGAAAGDTIFTCPMHPQIRQPSPGRCPICGMALEPAATGDARAADPMAITVDPVARRLANIQTAKARREPVQQTINTVGAIAIDESRKATIPAYVAGRIERLFADYTGVDVARDDHLAVLYSPSLYSAQVEYLQSRQAAREMDQAALPVVRQTQQRLADNSRQRLVELGMTERQITELEQSGEARSRLTIYAPTGGTVIEKLAVEGQYVEVGEPIYRIANLSTLWLMLQLYPEDASRIRFGQRVEANVQSLPGETSTGRVAFISPVVDPNRTVGVRVELANPDGKLRPGDYANARIHVPMGPEGQVYDADLAGKWISPMHPQIIRDQAGECPICGMDLVSTRRYGYSDTPVPQPTALVVPRSAVLMAGDNSVVYVETEPGRFELRPVKLGPLARDTAVILDGVKEGEAVATSGNFLIDSQMQLSGKPSLIDPTRAVARPTAPEDGPLALTVDAQPLTGEPGRQLEQLYAAYLAIQQTLAADQKPTEAHVSPLVSAADQLLADETVPDAVRQLVRTVRENALHLHHLDIKEAREHFRPISHAALQLAALYRGESAQRTLIHFFCPMVKGGGGDWLQDARPLANPYYGSEMLRCGDQVRVLPPPVEEPAAAASNGTPEE